MRTIILPGYSPRNKEWAEGVAKELGSDVVVHNWKHWPPAQRASGSERQVGSFSLKYEVGEIKKEIGEEEVNIIAKSVGTRVAMQIIAENVELINKLILCGLPIRWEEKIADTKYKELANLSPSQILVIQNAKDPLGNFSVSKKFVGQISSKIKVVEGDRSDHHYPYSEEFAKFLN